MVPSRYAVAATLLLIAGIVAAHGDDPPPSMDMDMTATSTINSTVTTTGDPRPTNYSLFWMPKYADLSSHTGLLLAHVLLEVIAWVIVLPVGVAFSIARTRLALPVQLAFLILNGLGVLFGTIYNVKTPDLYEHNAHHSIGWIATWVMTAQVAMMLVFMYSGRFKREGGHTQIAERTAFLPMTTESMVQHNQRPYSDYRWSADGGQGSSRSSTLNSRDVSPNHNTRREQLPNISKEDVDLDEDDMEVVELTQAPQRRSFLRSTFFDRALSRHVPSILSDKVFNIIGSTYMAVDCTILILGFIALLSGGIVYAGLFRALNLFNGLAHFIKGGIFFWYGLLTLGRWMGCFAEVGWAWNIKPTRGEVRQWKAAIPSAEFVESFVIFLYGCTNVFLEHLAASDGPYTAEDFEHISITLMFFGGGLMGMLVESQSVRKLLSATTETISVTGDVQSPANEERRAQPKSYTTPMNPMPAIIIMLLGIMMGSHHQSSMVSTMVHKQWGTLFVAFALARGVTYLITYISPPTSIYPSRPPSELVSAFCLISGGLIFMASTKDIIYVMETNNIMAMFAFTVGMGLTAVIMAWEITVFALKGWALRRQRQQISSSDKY